MTYNTVARDDISEKLLELKKELLTANDEVLKLLVEAAYEIKYLNRRIEKLEETIKRIDY